MNLKIGRYANEEVEAKLWFSFLQACIQCRMYQQGCRSVLKQNIMLKYVKLRTAHKFARF